MAKWEERQDFICGRCGNPCSKNECGTSGCHCDDPTPEQKEEIECNKKRENWACIWFISTLIIGGSLIYYLLSLGGCLYSQRHLIQGILK